MSDPRGPTLVTPTRRHLLRATALAAAGSFVVRGPAAEAAPASAPATRPAAPPPSAGGPSILLYSGWATHNIGDIGHTPGTLRYFAEHLPDVRVTCWLRKTNDAVTAMLRRRFPNVALVQGELDIRGKATTPELQAAFDAAGLFVYNSGMHFNRYWKPPIGVLQACRAVGKPYGLYGQSFEGFWPEYPDAVQQLIGDAAFVYTRDGESLAFLRRAGVAPPVLEFGPDGCFGIDVRDDAAADAFITANGLSEREFLAVAVRTDLIEMREKLKTDPNAAAVVEETAERWCAAVRGVIEGWVRGGSGRRVVLVAEVEKEVAAAKARVYDKLPKDVRDCVVHRKTFWNADEAVSFYGRAEAVLSMEPHSCIMALAAGTPAVHYFSPSHGTKAYMFRDVGLPEWLIDIDADPPAAASAALDRIHDHYGAAVAKAKRAMDFVNRRSGEMAGEVRRAIKA